MLFCECEGGKVFEIRGQDRGDIKSIFIYIAQYHKSETSFPVCTEYSTECNACTLTPLCAYCMC